MTERPSDAPARPSLGSSLVVCAGMLGLGAFVLQQGFAIGGEQSGYARVGPHVFPLVVGTGIVLIGLCLLVSALRGALPVVWAEADDGAGGRSGRRHLGRVALVAAGLVANVALIGPLGFVVASSATFFLTARAFGSRRPFLDAAVAFLFTGAVYLIFSRLLGLPLPAGTLWGGAA